MIDIKRLKKELATPTFRNLNKFLLQKLAQLKDIENIQDYSRMQDQAIEVKAQKKAYKKLSEILDELITLESVPDETEKPNSDYGEDYIQVVN